MNIHLANEESGSLHNSSAHPTERNVTPFANKVPKEAGGGCQPDGAELLTSTLRRGESTLLPAQGAATRGWGNGAGCAERTRKKSDTHHPREAWWAVRLGHRPPCRPSKEGLEPTVAGCPLGLTTKGPAPGPELHKGVPRGSSQLLEGDQTAEAGGLWGLEVHSHLGPILQEGIPQMQVSLPSPGQSHCLFFQELFSDPFL